MLNFSHSKQGGRKVLLIHSRAEGVAAAHTMRIRVPLCVSASRCTTDKMTANICARRLQGCSDKTAFSRAKMNMSLRQRKSMPRRLPFIRAVTPHTGGRGHRLFLLARGPEPAAQHSGRGGSRRARSERPCGPAPAMSELRQQPQADGRLPAGERVCFRECFQERVRVSAFVGDRPPLSLCLVNCLLLPHRAMLASLLTV